METMKMNKEWPIWDVFVRSKQGLDHKHCGSCTHRTRARLCAWRATCTRDTRKA
ncbi:MAG: 1,2-phenylacetyl-CoA epoxidase, subunit B (EC [uncultured Caballeronia sp.]|nr:MAG: 1,2-phenylacetyl-CoA epoxidase, subunit B (EC [uncultured Caballeronia sp.]